MERMAWYFFSSLYIVLDRASLSSFTCLDVISEIYLFFNYYYFFVVDAVVGVAFVVFVFVVFVFVVVVIVVVGL